MSDIPLQVVINHMPHTLPHGSSLADAVAITGVQPPFAAAVNLQFVPRCQYDQYSLANHDEIELISPIAGG
jgi:sulfur carrier protein